MSARITRSRAKHAIAPAVEDETRTEKRGVKRGRGRPSTTTKAPVSSKAEPALKKARSAAYKAGSNVSALFGAYDSGDGELGPAQAMRLLADAHIDASSIEALMLAYYCGCERPGYFSRSEFVEGLTRIHCDTPERLAAYLRAHAADHARTQLDDVWRFTFEYLKEKEQAKAIRAADAAPAVELLLGHYPHTAHFLDFLKASDTHKVLNFDHWNMLLSFVGRVGPPPLFAGYSEDDAWPVVIDDFVEYCREHQ